jgi:hypothetical protein
MSYLIRVTDHVNKSDRIINHLTNLDTYNSDFNTIINHLNANNELRSTLSNGVAELSKTEQVIVPGYFYNSSKPVTTLVYTLNIIKVDENLSDLFRIQHESSQTTSFDISKNLQTKETQSDSSTTDQSSQVSEEINQLTRQYQETSFFRDEEEFGEFQDYTSCPIPEFTNVDLNTYNNNVIIPPYTPYSPYSPYCQPHFDSNPFQRMMNLRGENQDLHFTFGSQVPQTPTQVVTSWAPELVNELKCRLAQPNAGLTSTNSSVNYFL